MLDWFIFLRGLALGLLLALLLGALLRFRQYHAVRCLALLALSLSGYVVAPLLYGKSQWFHIAVLLADTIPMVFLLFVQALFADHRRPSPRTLLFGALYLAMGYAGVWFPGAIAVDVLSVSPLWLLSRLLMAAMLAYALYLTLRQWRQDLVEPRRRLRLTVVVIGGAYILGVLVVETVAADIPSWVELLNAAGIVASNLLFLAVVISLGPEGLVQATAVTEPLSPRQATETSPEMSRVLTAMEEDKLYRDMELTIRSLGERLAIPEHRLRRLINRELGYRNFNDFLNHYRLGEVSRRLEDMESRQIPILTIAMDAGYRSLTTFNRAFKATFGLTPREYREKH